MYSGHGRLCVCLSLAALVPGLFVPKTFRSQERIVPMGNFRSRDFSFPGTFVPGERKFLGTFVPWTFRSEELSFLRLFYKALAMNAGSYSTCQNLFRSRPSSVCFPKNKLSKLKVRPCCFFLLNKNAK